MIFFSPYELTALNQPLNVRAKNRKRAGALLKYRDPEGRVGYGDLHPWPEFGDLPWEEQLRLLARGHTTEVSRRSLEFAAIDAKARAEGKNLFENLKLPLNHRLFLTLDLNKIADQVEGFAKIKIKAGPHTSPHVLKDLIRALPVNVQVRLDFNMSLKPAEFMNFVSLIQDIIDRIDFVEDPCEDFTSLAVSDGVFPTLARDRARTPDGFTGVYVIKPAWQSPKPGTLNRVVFTHNMDHPVGQIAALWRAAQFYQDHTPEICGFLWKDVYKKNEFSEHIQELGPRIMAPTGPGFGFGEELFARLPWTQLSD